MLPIFGAETIILVGALVNPIQSILRLQLSVLLMSTLNWATNIRLKMLLT